MAKLSGAVGTAADKMEGLKTSLARFMDDGSPRTTNYNIAAIIAGLDDNAIRQK